jgi:hypothetical protein
MSDDLEALLQGPLVVINPGVPGFAQSLEQQQVEVVQVDWAPPAGVTRR